MALPHAPLATVSTRFALTATISLPCTFCNPHHFSLNKKTNGSFCRYYATRKAREIATAPGNNKPVLVEYMTFRVGHHSTSDDASAYRGIFGFCQANSTNQKNKKITPFDAHLLLTHRPNGSRSW
jgi:hypothetical protein